MSHDDATFSWIEPRGQISLHGFRCFVFDRARLFTALLVRVTTFALPLALTLPLLFSVGLWMVYGVDLSVLYHCAEFGLVGFLLIIGYFCWPFVILPVWYIEEQLQRAQVKVGELGIRTSTRRTYDYRSIREARICSDAHGQSVLRLKLKRTRATKKEWLCVAHYRTATDIDTQQLLHFIETRIRQRRE